MRISNIGIVAACFHLKKTKKRRIGIEEPHAAFCISNKLLCTNHIGSDHFS